MAHDGGGTRHGNTGMTRQRILAAALALSLAQTAWAQGADPVQVRIMSINDFHGNLDGVASLTLTLPDPGTAPGTPPLRVQVGGAAALAGMVKKLRAGAPHSVMVAGGDLIGAAPLTSTIFMHESTVEILGDIGLDISSLGNHEFDAGEKELQRIIHGGCAPATPGNPATSCAQGRYRGARYKYIAANVTDAKGRHIVAPYVIKRFDGIPVAFIGGVTKTTPQLVSPSGIAGLRFGDEADAVNRAADELRAQGVRAMVAVFHEGMELASTSFPGAWNDVTCPGARGPLLDIARRLAPEIRVVISGHSHQGYRCEVGGRLLIQSTSYGRAIGVIDIELDRSTRAMLPPVRSINLPLLNALTEPAQRAKLAAATPEPFGAVLRDTQPDPSIADRVAHLAKLVAPKADRPIGTLGGNFTRGGRVDSTAGRLVADAQLAATRGMGAQIALMNPAGIRTDLECTGAPPCPVTYGQAFTMQPFGNSLVVMTLTGAQLKAVLESQQGSSPNVRWILQPSEGFTYTWQSDAAPGERVRDMRLDGAPVTPERTYRVTVNSFLADGGDGFVLLREGRDLKGGGPDLDALVAYLGAATRVPLTEPRITRLP